MSKPAKPDRALGVVVRQLRRRVGLRQQELAAGAGVTVSVLSRIERGVSNPKWTTVAASRGHSAWGLTSWAPP